MAAGGRACQGLGRRGLQQVGDQVRKDVAFVVGALLQTQALCVESERES